MKKSQAACGIIVKPGILRAKGFVPFSPLGLRQPAQGLGPLKSVPLWTHSVNFGIPNSCKINFLSRIFLQGLLPALSVQIQKLNSSQALELLLY